MTKYPVKYASSSKGEVDIESMATPHLANAWRKFRDQRLGPTPNRVDGPFGVDDYNQAVEKALFAELRSRSCTYNPETDQWTFPPKPTN